MYDTKYNETIISAELYYDVEVVSHGWVATQWWWWAWGGGAAAMGGGVGGLHW